MRQLEGETLSVMGQGLDLLDGQVDPGVVAQEGLGGLVGDAVLAEDHGGGNGDGTGADDERQKLVGSGNSGKHLGVCN